MASEPLAQLHSKFSSSPDGRDKFHGSQIASTIADRDAGLSLEAANTNTLEQARNIDANKGTGNVFLQVSNPHPMYSQQMGRVRQFSVALRLGPSPPAAT